MPNKPKSAAIWNPFTAKSRADRSAQEMYPGKIGQDDQRDAARHMLASGYLAKAWSPGVADLIGKAHEFKETPFRHLGALAGVAQHRYDRPIDLHNNTLGIELAQKAGSMEEFERLVNEAAERARPTQMPGVPWVPSAKDAEVMRKGSAQYQAGGLVKGGLKTLDNLVMKATKGRTAAKDVFASDFQTIPEKELMRMNSIEREQRVPMQSIVPTQPDVKTETALEYMMSNRVRDPGTKKMPEVVKWGDKYYIMDGHHRVAGQLALDKTDIPVQVIGEVPALKKADGGLVAAFKDGGAATGFFPQMKPQRAGHSGAGERMTEEALKFFIPQDTTDLALMAFPFGKAGKAAAAGLMALTPADAEAGKLKTGVDLARRSLFGLRPSQDMAGRELAPLQRDLDRMQAELAKAEKVAPKVEQKTTTVQPSPTAPKIEQTVKSIAETPVSRRTVLKTAAGQVMQNALPASSFADLMKPATVVKQAVQAVAPAAAVTASSVPALMAKAVKMGMDSDEALAFVKRELGESAETVMAKQDPELLYDTLKDPFESIVDDPEWLYKFKNGKQDRLMGPGELLQVQLGQGETPGPLKETLRALKAEMSPEDYANMKNAMKDAINQEIKYGGDY